MTASTGESYKGTSTSSRGSKTFSYDSISDTFVSN
jgi:hypothetical protein